VLAAQASGTGMVKSKYFQAHGLVIILVVALVIAILPLPQMAFAQNFSATTLENAKLRSGAGTNFPNQEIIPAGTSIIAIGRNTESTWIQVNYNGTIGWVQAYLLEVDGNPSRLPVTISPRDDTINSTSTEEPAADSVVNAVTITTINVRAFPRTGTRHLGVLSPVTEIVLVARSGTGNAIWYGIDYNGQRGWVAGWLLRIDGNTNTIPDVTDRLPALEKLQASLDSAIITLEPIENVWYNLANGQNTFCSSTPFPPPLVADIDESILEANPDISETLQLLNFGVDETQKAIDAWDNECSLDREIVTDEVVTKGVQAVDNANNAFIEVQNRINTMYKN
jgi:uncharacterized protein YraI